MSRNLSNKGFTLIELLVVVAIIGILATTGIPQYRRMVAKSKQAEAKVALGEVSTAQSAFYTEYGTYGNNLREMGVQSDTSVSNGAGPIVNAGMIAAKTYIYGFLSANCGANGGNVFPANNSPAGLQIVNNIPNYYNAYTDAKAAAGAADTNSTAFGRTTRSGNCGAVAPAATATTYNADASGVIISGLSLDDPGAANLSDVWSVSQTRIITNSQSGLP